MILAPDILLNNLTVLDGTKTPLVLTYNVVTFDTGGQIQLLGDVTFRCKIMYIKDNSSPAVILGTNNSLINIDFEMLNGKFVIDLSGNPDGKVLVSYKQLGPGASIDAVPKYSVQQYS